MKKSAKRFTQKIQQSLENSGFLNGWIEKNTPKSFAGFKLNRNSQAMRRMQGELKNLRAELEVLKKAQKQSSSKKVKSINAWDQFYDAQVLENYQEPLASIVDNFESTVARFPKRDFLVFQGTKIDYQSVDRYSSAIAASLQERGFRKGERVAIQLPNIPQIVAAYYGVLKAGGVVVFVNPLYTEDEIFHQLNDAKPVCLITLDVLYDKRIRKLQKSLSSLRRILLCDIKSFLPAHLKKLYPLKAKRTGMLAEIRKDDPVEFLDQIMLEKDPLQYRRINLSLDDLAVLQYTGGTTGRAKGAMLSHRNLAANIAQLSALQYTAQPGEESILTAVPIFHVLGMSVCMNFGAKIGASLILVPKFDIDMIVKAITRYQPTFFPGVPTMFVAFNNYPRIQELDISSIKSCFSGSAPLPEQVMKRFEQLTGAKIIEGYGLSECSPVTHVNPLYGERKLNSIGIPLPGTKAKVVDPDTGETLAPGKPGELWISGPQVMQGYWNMEEETNNTLEKGWLKTGDVAQCDEDGYFYIVDRIKDMIIAGGYNIYPREIDEVLFAHPDIEEAVCVGIADDYRGETLKAYIVKKKASKLTAKQVQDYCKARLAAYKVPTQVEFRSELPKNMVGKILRKVLRDEEAQKNKKLRKAS